MKEIVHVVVEHGVLVTVHIQKALCVAHTEVLEVEETMRVVLADKLDEFVDELIICLAAYAVIRPALIPVGKWRTPDRIVERRTTYR